VRVCRERSGVVSAAIPKSRLTLTPTLSRKRERARAARFIGVEELRKLSAKRRMRGCRKGSIHAPRIAQSRGRGDDGEFGNMRVDAIDPCHPTRAEPRAQAIEEIGERVRPFLLRRAREIALRGRDRLGEKTGETQHVEAIAGVEFVLVGRFETLAEQARDRTRFVERPAGADDDAAHRAVDAEEGRFKPPRALGLALQQDGQILGEFGDRRLDRLLLHDRAGEAPLGGKIRRGEARRNRRALQAAKRVKPRDDLLAETRSDRRARAQRDIADAP
jgi:hypothetical protein